MDERRAREVTLLEAFETAQPRAPSWSDDDRALGRPRRARGGDAGAPLDAFVATRARHALQRLAPREPALARARRPQLRGARGWPGRDRADRLRARPRRRRARRRRGASTCWRRRSGACCAWNAGRLPAPGRAAAGARWRGAARRARGPIVRSWPRMLLRLRQRLPSRVERRRRGRGARASPALWLARSRGLALAARRDAAARRRGGARARPDRRALCARPRPRLPRRLGEHLPRRRRRARASSRPCSAPAARAVGHRACPTPRRSRRCGSVAGDAGGGAPAAPWIHLHRPDAGAGRRRAARVARARLRAAAAAGDRARFALPLDEPYFQRLAAPAAPAARRASSSCRTAATPSPQATLGLRALLAARRSAATRLDVRIAPRVAFGAEDDAPADVGADTTHAIALFDLARDARGREPDAASLRRLAAALPTGAVLAAVVDESAFARRFAGLDGRVAERREAWRALGRRRTARRSSVSVDLEMPARRRCAPSRTLAERARVRRRAAGGAMSAAAAAPSRSAWSRTPTRARRRSPARCSARDIGEVRDAPHVTEFAEAHDADRDARRASGCCSGTRRASATACGWCSGCARPSSRSAGS